MTSIRIIAPDRHIDISIDLAPHELDEILEVIELAEVRQHIAEQQRLRDEEARIKAANAETLRRLREAFHYFDRSMGQARTWTSSFAGAGAAFAAGASTFNNAPQTPERPKTPRTEQEALTVIRHYVEGIGQNTADLRKAVRRAKREAHPDTGGTAPDFHLVTAAEDILRRARRI